MEPGIDLLGCEYLGGCPTVGSRVLNKVGLHFDAHGLTMAVAPQGLFTPAAARPVLVLAWSQITALSVTHACRGPTPSTPRRMIRSVFKVLATRLDLPDQVAIATEGWTMTVGVRMAGAELAGSLHDLLARCEGPAPAVTAT